MCGNNGQPFYYRREDNGWTVGRFRALEELDSITHVVTTRQGPDLSGATDVHQPTTIREIASFLGIEEIAFCRQVHAATVLDAKAGGLLGEGDAIVTNVRSLGLMALSADCPLIIAADPLSRTVGVAHASWRGTVRRIASKLITHMAVGYSVRPEDVVACISPSAGPCCYEVGEDLHTAVVRAIGASAERLFREADGRMYFDLWAAGVEELVLAGLKEENIHVSGECTICHNDKFPSYRVEGSSAGRFAAVIGYI